LFGATVNLIHCLHAVNWFFTSITAYIGINYGCGNYERLKKAYFNFYCNWYYIFFVNFATLTDITKIFLNLLWPDVDLTNNDLLNFRIYNALTPLWAIAVFGNTLFLL
jgi:hypothetical protein